MASSLPSSPSLDRIKDDARSLQRAVRSGDARARRVVRRWHPKTAGLDLDHLPLHAAQTSIARRYGFTTWAKLVAYLDLTKHWTTNPSAVDEEACSPADRFCALACLGYDARDEPARWERAAAQLENEPGLVDDSIWAAAAAADPAALSAHLARDPQLAVATGGPYRWAPLMYLTYSRLGNVRPRRTAGTATLACARTLLAAGADPNTGYLWRGLATPFTALTGVFGEGEQGAGRQPRHPAEQPLARLLLGEGADANDAQALYNRMFRRDDSHLVLLLEFGLGRGDGGPWKRRLGEAAESPRELLVRQLGWAASHGFTDRVALLVEHGLALDAPLPRLWGIRAGRSARQLLQEHAEAPASVNELVDGRTALHQAAWDGDLTRIEELLAAGADPTIRDATYSGTALNWAQYAHQPAAIELLAPVTPD